MKENKKAIYFKLAIIFLSILLTASFWLTVRAASDPVSMTVIPQAPREGEPIIAIFKLSNPSSRPLVTRYRFYASGQLIKDGTTTIAPASYESHRYAYENPLRIGEQLNFTVRAESRLGNHEKVFSSPSYPPQVWSSFVSFASFSTSLISSLGTMTYYRSTFGSDMGLNIGIIASIVLIVLLIFMELTQPVLAGRTIAKMGRLKVRLSTVSWILLIIFMGIVYTKVVMVLAT